MPSKPLTIAEKRVIAAAINLEHFWRYLGVYWERDHAHRFERRLMETVQQLRKLDCPQHRQEKEDSK